LTAFLVPDEVVISYGLLKDPAFVTFVGYAIIARFEFNDDTNFVGSNYTNFLNSIHTHVFASVDVDMFGGTSAAVDGNTRKDDSKC
jgi:hypothetical protein